MREISSTPLPGEWSTFKAELVESDNYSASGASAKLAIAESYRNVQLMTLENVRGEGTSSLFEGKFAYKKFRGATAFDELLTRRMSQRGSIVMTSLDFIGQIGESLGDRLPETLLSEKTSLVLMLSLTEADALLSSLKDRCIRMNEACVRACGHEANDPSSKDFTGRRTGEAEADLIKSALYMGDVLGNIPGRGMSIKPCIDKLNAAVQKGSATPVAKEVCQKFTAEKKTNGLDYQQNLKRAMILAVMDCGFASKLTERECLEIGEMASIACGPQEKIDEMLKTALLLRDEMSGVTNG
jgi:hypothetical protein